MPTPRAVLTELAQLDKSDFDVALRKILAEDSAHLEVARVSYWELAPDHSSIRCRVMYHRHSKELTEGGELLAVDFPAYFDALIGTRTIVAHDAWTDPRTSEFVDAYFRPNNIRAMLDVPVWRRGKLAGVICHEHVGDARTWRNDEQDFCAGIGNMVSVALEASDRRRAEESHALLAGQTNDVIWDLNVTTGALEFNDALCRVFGYPREDLESQCRWWVERVHPEDRERVDAKLRAALEDTAVAYDDQYRWQRADGSYATVIDRGRILRNAAGAAVRMVGSMLDITERVQMQQRLAHSDRMASIGTLAAGVAHEINNPLTFVRANLTCALEDLRGSSPDLAALGEMLREALDGADRVRRVVRDLQMFSRPREDETEHLDIGTVIDSSVAMAWNEIRHRARLIKDLGSVPQVRMNRSRLGQVLLNLLVNAAQAIAEGNVENNQIRISTRTAPNGNAVIEIRDTGCGIPTSALSRIFEPFFTTKPVGVGTGLGLSICHGIISAAGGRIEISSPTSGGCRVRVELPACAEAQPVAQPEPEPVTRKQRVLLIDDEPAVGRVFKRLLEPAHEVHVIDDGQRALDAVMSGADYDAIFCDLMMPNMSGAEIYERLRVDAPAMVDRIAFVTGGAFGERSTDFLATCERPVVEKPFDRGTLQRTLRELRGA